MVTSMTGFASGTGELAPYTWHWELRSVNAKGLDLRLRVPDWISGFEASVRARLGKSISRGNVNLSLRISREETSGSVQVNQAALSGILDALHHAEQAAAEKGVTLQATSGADLLGFRGVLEQASEDETTDALTKALMIDFDTVLQNFLDMRGCEGQALFDVLSRALDEIQSLVDAATDAVAARKSESEAAFRAALDRVTRNTDGVDEDRVAQELAVLAVKADVTEELDRLHAHVTAARHLLQDDKPIGRKLDFLMQEFNREANTLCSKSQNKALTRVGLDLKTVIDQMREQVQNVE